MERPGSSLLASIAVHGAVVLAVVGYGMLGFTRAPLDVENAVPVSIISETVIEAAAPDTPDDELVTEDAATAPVAPTPPEPVPPEPAPLPGASSCQFIDNPVPHLIILQSPLRSNADVERSGAIEPLNGDMWR